MARAERPLPLAVLAALPTRGWAHRAAPSPPFLQRPFRRSGRVWQGSPTSRLPPCGGDGRQARGGLFRRWASIVMPWSEMVPVCRGRIPYGSDKAIKDSRRSAAHECKTQRNARQPVKQPRDSYHCQPEEVPTDIGIPHAWKWVEMPMIPPDIRVSVCGSGPAPLFASPLFGHSLEAAENLVAKAFLGHRSTSSPINAATQRCHSGGTFSTWTHDVAIHSASLANKM